MKSCFIAAVILSWATPSAAERFSRAAAIARATSQNPQVTAARLEIAAARSLRDQAAAASWPSVTLRAGVGPSLQAKLVPGSAVRSTENNFSDVGFGDLSVVLGGQVQVVQPLYTFGKIGLRRRAATFGVRAKRAEVRMTRAEIALEVARLYESHLFARDAARFFEEVEHNLDRAILATEARLAASAATVNEQDLLRLESARSATRLALHRARAGIEQSAVGLRAYLAMPEQASVDLVDRTLEPVGGGAPEVDALSVLALKRRPELEALAAGSAALHSAADAENAGYYPDLFVMGWISGAYTPGRDWIGTRYVVDPLQHFVPGLLVGVQWTLQGGQSGARAREKRAAAQRLAKLGEWARLGVRAEVRKALEDVARARKDIDEAKTGVLRAKKWVVRASADYAAGLADSQGLVDALQSYATLRLADLDARLRFNIGMAELAKASGTLGNTSGLYPGPS